MIYLGSLKTEDGKDKKEIERRIELARRVSQCYIWLMSLYGSETWTLTKVIQNKVEAYEMWIYRRMMRISCTEHKSNEEVLEMTIS